MAAPVEAQVEIDGMSHEGRGIGRLDGKTVFIDGALAGELVRFRYTQRRGRHDEGSVTEVLRAAPERVEPRCLHYGVCGACSLQHFAAEAQLAHKHKVLAEQLQYQAKVVPGTLLPAVRGPLWGYRHKARLSVRYVEKKGRVVLGFMEKRGRMVADLQRCEILHPSVGERLEAIRTLLGSLSVCRQLPQLEVAVGEAETALVIRHLAPLSQADLDLCRAFAEAQQLSLFGQSGGPESVVRLWPQSTEELYYRLGEAGATLTFRPLDFTQINPAINRELVGQVLQLLDPRPDEHVLDLFCGLGNFTLPLAGRALRVTGIEGDAGLIARARVNADQNSITNVEFLALDLTNPQPVLSLSYAKVLLDPPRTGALAAINHLDCTTIKRLVYVSCNPATLARDAQVLTQEKGFELLSAGVLDMFPHTSHVESIACFQRS
jgi:23S rRNA (uracil1939-C5)-methyltransferase